MSDLAALLAAIALLAGNTFFVGAEFALVAARRSQLEPLAEQGSGRARSTLAAMGQVSLMMAGAQLGITLCSLGLGAVGEPLVAHLLEPVLHAMRLPAQVLHPLAFAVALLIVAALHVVVGEMVPKNVVLATPERAALLLGPILAGFVTLLGPVLRLLNALANLTLRAMRVQPQEEVPQSANLDEVSDLLAHSRREGLMDPEEYARTRASVAFQESTARDVMVPWTDLHVLPQGATAEDVEAMAGDTGHSRFPITDPSETYARYAHVKDVIDIRADDRSLALPERLLRPLPTVAPDASLLDVLEVMRHGATHMIRVAGRGEQAQGVVALDDVLLALLPSRPPR